jgi:hypothetical protein
MAVPEHHIREAVARYVSAEIGRGEFQEWFIPRAWELLDSEPSPAASLASEIELALAEFTNGYLTEQELRDRLSVVASIPVGRLFHVQSSLAISVTGGPLQNTIAAHQVQPDAEMFWVEVASRKAAQAA